jgi:hypothetical protein
MPKAVMQGKHALKLVGFWNTGMRGGPLERGQSAMSKRNDDKELRPGRTVSDKR